MSNCGDDRVRRIPSLLRGSVVVNVTLEDILHFVVLLFYYYLIIVVPPSEMLLLYLLV